MAEMSPLCRRMIEDMTVRNLSPATQRSYIHAIVKFCRFSRRSTPCPRMFSGGVIG
jgi:integrase/recombinase XerD